MNQASNIKVVLPTLKSDKGYTDLPRFCRDFDDKVAGLQHGKPLVKLKNHLTGRPDHTVTVAPSFLSVPGLDRRAPGEQTAQTAGPDAGGILSPVKPSVTPSTSQESEAIRDGTCYCSCLQKAKIWTNICLGNSNLQWREHSRHTWTLSETGQIGRAHV